MIKEVFLMFMGLMMTISMTSCHFVSPDADEEAVLIYKPWIFGHGGVDDEPITTGLTWCWASTHSDQQLKEMNNTAAAIQARQTQERITEREQARENAEVARAMADKAYMREMNLTPDQFIMLKIVEKGSPNIDVVMGGGSSPIWNVRR